MLRGQDIMTGVSISLAGAGMRQRASRPAPWFFLREPPWFFVVSVVKTCLLADERTPRLPNRCHSGTKMRDTGARA